MEQEKDEVESVGDAKEMHRSNNNNNLTFARPGSASGRTGYREKAPLGPTNCNLAGGRAPANHSVACYRRRSMQMTSTGGGRNASRPYATPPPAGTHRAVGLGERAGRVSVCFADANNNLKPGEKEVRSKFKTKTPTNKEGPHCQRATKLTPSSGATSHPGARLLLLLIGLIAYELYVQLLLASQRHHLNSSSCHKCLPDVVARPAASLIRACSAAELNETGAGRRAADGRTLAEAPTNLSPAPMSLAPGEAEGQSSARKWQGVGATDANSSSSSGGGDGGGGGGGGANNNNNNGTKLPSNASGAAGGTMGQRAPSGVTQVVDLDTRRPGGGGGEPGQREEQRDNDNGTSLAAARASQITTTRTLVGAGEPTRALAPNGSASSGQTLVASVICNSRCNCVILDLAQLTAERAQAGPGEPAGGAGAPANNNNKEAPAPNNNKNATEALIAFSEDYSLDDYEQPATGNGPASGANGDDPELEQANGPLAAFQQPFGAGGSDRAPPASGQPQADQSSGRVRAAANVKPKQTTLEVRRQPGASGGQAHGEATDPSQSIKLNQLKGGGGAASDSNRTLEAGAPGSAGQQLFALPAGHPQGQSAAPSGAPAGDSQATGPQLYAQSLYSSSAPMLSVHAHSPYFIKPGGAASEPAGGGAGGELVAPAGGPFVGHHHARLHHAQRPMARLMAKWAPPTGANLVHRLLPLRPLDLSDGGLVQTHPPGQPDQVDALARRVELMLGQIAAGELQSLVLRNNNIQFELWTELSALLAIPMRKSLFHLDLSHNSLTKLGVTFTGYIEHNLIVASHQHQHQHQHQQQAAGQASWPFATTAPPTNHTKSSNMSSPSMSSSNNLPAASEPNNPIGARPQMKSLSSKRPRHPILGDGKLYNLVVQYLMTNRTAPTSLLLVNSAAQVHQPTLIKALDLSHNKLKWLINDQFRSLKHVQAIRLDHNRIRYIHQQAFSGLESLRYLNLNFNRIQTIYVEQFQTNFNLLALMMRANYLAYLRAGSFASLSNLKRLDLSRNKFTILSNNAFVGLESLELLNCSSNQFVHVPSASLHPLTSIKRLDLSGNQIAQLAPGTFFHLSVEELWLNENEQLVAIDRGAFWDLPYLRRLHLRSNSMLMSINSQAFVGTQKLQLIDVEECPSLDSSARQMLDNITMAATSRQLRHEQQQQQQQQQHQQQQQQLARQRLEGSPPLGQSSESQLVAANPTTVGQVAPDTNQTAQDQQKANQMALGDHQRLLKQQTRMKYIYSFGLLTLLIVALKLVFKYTSNSHYLAARRRARRVYEAKPSSSLSDFEPDESCGSISGASNSIALCEQSKIHVIGANSSNNIDEASASQPRRVSATSDAPTGGQDQPEVERPPPVGPDADDDGLEEIGLEKRVGGEEVNVITRQPLAGADFCPDCPRAPAATSTSPGGEIIGPASDELAGAEGQPTTPASCCDRVAAAGTQEAPGEPAQQVAPAQEMGAGGRHSSAALDLIHSQLVAAGFDYGHANCLHFYQSLGPALQLADMTASFVNQMDYY